MTIRCRLLGCCLLTFFLSLVPALAQGISWPTNQLLPTFAPAAGLIEVIDLDSRTGDEADLFASAQGLVNRVQPRIACVSSSDGEGKNNWLDLHAVPYVVTNGYGLLLKYRTNFNGLVVTDPAQAHTLNLATTIAGVSNLLICAPTLLTTLTNSPYNFAIVEDLRGRFADQLQAYRFLYTNYYPYCTHQMVSGLYTNLHGNLRDYLVALKVANLWLDPGVSAEAAVLAPYFSGIQPMKAIYTGWWPSEANGLNWISTYGVPVLASDWVRNGSLFSGMPRPINVPEIPPPPPLTNKVYVAFILSDGDNIQYMQHAMKIRWGQSGRGTIPIGWTMTPLSAEMDPAMLNYYWSTATTNDCLMSGPSGAGYTHMQRWNPANLAAFTRTTDSYLRQSGVRTITIWDQVTTGVARSFATNCTTLLGLTDQSGGTYTSVNLGLRSVGLTVTYSPDTNAIYSGITNAARNWTGTSPMFLAVQAVSWNLTVADLKAVLSFLDPAKYSAVRPDHLFLLYNGVYAYPTASTRQAAVLSGNSATLQGLVVPNASNSVAWIEYGTNATYTSKTATTNVSGTTVVPVRMNVNGLTPRTTYHFRVGISNALGRAYGTDRIFTIGNQVKAWGYGEAGQTNLPPGLTNVVQISAGTNHVLALRNDGTVVAWGDNTAGQSDVTPGLSNVIDVAAGINHNLALKSDGTLVAWGGNDYGQTNIPPGVTNIVAIAAGGDHSLALKANGTVTAWGRSDQGQTNVPAGLTNLVDLAAGATHNLALRADGTVAGWGNNSFGQASVPASLLQVAAVSAGQNHSVAMKVDATVSSNLVPVRRWVADALAGADNSSISNWVDSVGGRSAIQNSAGNRPRLFSNIINGHKVVRFSSASSQYLTVFSTNSPLSSAGSFTLVLVFKTTTPGVASVSFYLNTGLLGCEQPSAVSDWALCLNGNLLGAGLGAGASNCSSDVSMYGGSVTDGNTHIAMYVRAADQVSLYVDGVKVASQASLCANARGNYNFQIGAMSAGTLCYNGDIAEIQAFDRALTPLELVGVNENLAATYAVGGNSRPVVAWGSNAYGQNNVPNTLSNVVDVNGADTFDLALIGNGVVVPWGSNAANQSTLPPGLTNVSAISAAGNSALAIGNQAPIATNLVFEGYVSHDVAIQLSGVSPDGFPLTYRLLSLPTLGVLSQSTNGMRGAVVSETNAVVADPAGGLIYTPIAGETGNPYVLFTFTAEDGFFNSSSAQVRVNITAPAAPEFSSVLLSTNSPGAWVLNFTGASNATYSVWGSTNLVDWENLGTAGEAAPATYQFTDFGSTNFPQRFYRATAP